MALFLLKNCFSIPKLTYSIRCSPCFQHTDLLQNYDDTVMNILSKICNIALVQSSCEQACLPTAMGGLGIPKATVLALPAFLASADGSRSLSVQILKDAPLNEDDYEYAFAAWSEITNRQFKPENSMYQKSWSIPTYEALRDKLFDDLDEAGKRRLSSYQGKLSAAWLSALPSSNLGLKLTDAQVKTAMGSRLGSRLCEPHVCVCGKDVDSFGQHGLSCRRSAGRFSRHTALNLIVKQALGSVHIPSILEPPGLSTTDGKRPDGMSQVSWKRGQSLVWDVTVVDALAPSRADSFEPGKAAAEAEVRKNSKYAEISRSGHMFIPLAFEAQGQAGPECQTFIKELGNRLIHATKEPRAAQFLKQRISIAIQSANSACILGTIREVDSLDAIFYTL